MKILVFNKKKSCFKFISIALSLIMTLAIFSGCSSADNKPSDDGKLMVYTSFYPMYDLTSKIGGDKINVTNMVPTGTEPHDWEPTPKDMQAIANADVLVYNGLGMEQWIDKVTGAVDNDKLILVEASKGIDLITSYSDHEEEHSDNDNHDHDTDPHVWTSIRNAIVEMENIKNALCEADSENSAYYEENFNKYKAEFEALDKEFSDFTSSCKNKNIVVAHEAFSYLCRDYGLNQIAINGLSAEAEPDPARMAEIVDFAKKNNVKVIFFEELVSPKVAEVIAQEVGAETMVINPLEGLSDEEVNNGDDYLSVMRKNLEALKKALS